MAPKTKQARLCEVVAKDLAKEIGDEGIVAISVLSGLVGVPFSLEEHPRSLFEDVVALTTFTQTGTRPPVNKTEMVAPDPMWECRERIMQFIKIAGGIDQAIPHLGDDIDELTERIQRTDVDGLPNTHWGRLILIVIASKARIILDVEGSITPGALAALGSVSADHVRLLLRQKQIPGTRVGRAWRIEADVARRWLSDKGIGGFSSDVVRRGPQRRNRALAGGASVHALAPKSSSTTSGSASG